MKNREYELQGLLVCAKGIRTFMLTLFFLFYLLMPNTIKGREESFKGSSKDIKSLPYNIGEIAMKNVGLNDNDTYDVFFCYNSKDKSIIIKLAEKLKEIGITVWLDVWELRPGLSFQDAFNNIVGKVKSVAVFFGKNGIGPWQNEEQKAFIIEFVNRKVPVIPVILKECEVEPEIPTLLRDKTYVDFRKADPNPIVQLIWGITDKKVNSTPNNSNKYEHPLLSRFFSPFGNLKSRYKIAFFLIFTLLTFLGGFLLNSILNSDREPIFRDVPKDLTIKEALTLSSTNSEITSYYHTLTGRSYLEDDNIQKAIQEFEIALSLNSQNIVAAAFLCKAYKNYLSDLIATLPSNDEVQKKIKELQMKIEELKRKYKHLFKMDNIKDPLSKQLINNILSKLEVESIKDSMELGNFSYSDVSHPAFPLFKGPIILDLGTSFHFNNTLFHILNAQSVPELSLDSNKLSVSKPLSPKNLDVFMGRDTRWWGSDIRRILKDFREPKNFSNFEDFSLYFLIASFYSDIDNHKSLSWGLPEVRESPLDRLYNIYSSAETLVEETDQDDGIETFGYYIAHDYGTESSGRSLIDFEERGSLGNGKFSFLYPRIHPVGGGWSGYKALIGDFNGDVKTDILWNYTRHRNYIYIGISKGNDLFSYIGRKTSSIKGWSGYKAYTGDINGDGKTDIIWSYSGNDMNSTYVGFSRVGSNMQFSSPQIHPLVGNTPPWIGTSGGGWNMKISELRLALNRFIVEKNTPPWYVPPTGRSLIDFEERGLNRFIVKGNTSPWIGSRWNMKPSELRLALSRFRVEGNTPPWYVPPTSRSLIDFEERGLNRFIVKGNTPTWIGSQWEKELSELRLALSRFRVEGNTPPWYVPPTGRSLIDFEERGLNRFIVKGNTPTWIGSRWNMNKKQSFCFAPSELSLANWKPIPYQGNTGGYLVYYSPTSSNVYTAVIDKTKAHHGVVEGVHCHYSSIWPSDHKKKNHFEKLGKRLLSIGVNNYNNGERSLKYAASDAKKLADVLKVYGYKSTLLLNENAGKSSILEHIFGEALEDSNATLFIYFAGHGFSDNKGNKFIVPYSEDGKTDPIALDAIYSLLKFRKGKTIAIFDSCFDKRDIDLSYLTMVTATDYNDRYRSDPLFILSSSPGERAIESNQLTSGIATHTIIKFLSDNYDGANLEISFDKLFEYFRDNTRQKSQSYYNLKQTPIKFNGNEITGKITTTAPMVVTGKIPEN